MKTDTVRVPVAWKGLISQLKDKVSPEDGEKLLQANLDGETKGKLSLEARAVDELIASRGDVGRRAIRQLLIDETVCFEYGSALWELRQQEEQSILPV